MAGRNERGKNEEGIREQGYNPSSGSNWGPLVDHLEKAVSQKN